MAKLRDKKIDLPKDPELRRQVQELLERDQRQIELADSPEIIGPPKYVFDRHGGQGRSPGDLVRVLNAFEGLGGTIVEKLTDVAYVVRVMDDCEVVVHEPDEAWIPREA